LVMTDSAGMHVARTPDVDPQVLQQLATCTQDLLRQQADLVRVLHQRLLELVPDLAGTPDGGRQVCGRLVAAALHAADPGRPADRSASFVQQVGIENALDGFPADQYGSVTHAVLHAVRALFRGEWSSGLSSAWVEYLMWLRTNLLAGAEIQRAHQREREQPPAPSPYRPREQPEGSWDVATGGLPFPVSPLTYDVGPDDPGPRIVGGTEGGRGPGRAGSDAHHGSRRERRGRWVP